MPKLGMEKQKTSPRKKKTKPVSENENSASDHDNEDAVKGISQTKWRTKRGLDTKVKSYSESRDNESSSEEDASVIAKNRKEKDGSKNVTSGEIDSSQSKTHEDPKEVEHLSNASSDDIFSSAKNRNEKDPLPVSNDLFDSILSQNNKDNSLVFNSTEKKLSSKQGTNVSGAESPGLHSSSDEEDSLPTENKATQSSEESDSNASKDQSKKENIAEIKKTRDSDTVKTSPFKAKKDKGATRKQSERSPRKKPMSYAESPRRHSSSDEEDSLPIENRATQSSEESDSNASKDQSKKENISRERKIKVMPVIEKGYDSEKAFSDEGSSGGLPEIEKIFETLEEKAEKRSKSPSSAKISPRKKDDQIESIQKKDKTASAGDNSKPIKPSPSKEKKSKHSHPKQDKSPNSSSKEDIENDKTDESVSDLGEEKRGRGRPKKPLPHSKTRSDKVSSSDGGNTTSKGKANTTSKEKKIFAEKQKFSDSGVKNRERGRPRKSNSAAVTEKNGKLPSKDIANSQAESSPSRAKGDEVKENESGKESSKKPDIETSKAVTKSTSNLQGKLKPNAEASNVYAVKSKPPAKKRKGDETENKSKTRTRPEKHSDIRKSSRADSKVDASSVSDKNGSPANESDPKDSGEITSTTKKGQKRELVYTSSDNTSDDSDSKEISPKPKSDASYKKVKREFSCHKCDAKFTRTQQLFDHICDGKRDKGFACERCDKIYKLRSTYVNHKIIHSKKKPYKCRLCGKKSSSQSNHLYHMKNSHPERKPFLCEFFPCEKGFLTRGEQMDHHKKHKRFICKYCDEEFDKESTLLRHRHKVHEVFLS